MTAHVRALSRNSQQSANEQDDARVVAVTISRSKVNGDA